MKRPALSVKKIAEIIIEMKGSAVAIYDLRGKSDIADFAVIAEGNSTTHVRGMADSVYAELKTKGVFPRYEGRNFGSPGWAVLDTGTILVHLITGPKREHYNLDRLFENAKKVQC